MLVMIVYFWKQTKNPPETGEIENKAAMKALEVSRKIKLSIPISEILRPTDEAALIGQAAAMELLKSALSGPHPKHVIIYGPPGVGKTTAARLAHKIAKKSNDTPFLPHAPFIELDGSTLQFDERSFANPLMGSVHDPIYQGSNHQGKRGIPVPQKGAVSKAHGGILFIDEIGEMPKGQLSQLLKVLEDRKVFLQSAYYETENKKIPPHIHSIFTKGWPADFRLCAATTMNPEDIPEALRSRCVEIFFQELSAVHIEEIINNAMKMLDISRRETNETIGKIIATETKNGREAIKILEMALAYGDLYGETLTEKAVLAVLPKPVFPKIYLPKQKVGLAYGVAIFNGKGEIFPIETLAFKGTGHLQVTGAIEREKIFWGEKSSEKQGSVHEMIAVSKSFLSTWYDFSDWDLHIHFPSPMIIDGASVGVGVLLSIFSALSKKIIPPYVFTGTVDLYGNILPVSMLPEKINGVLQKGIEKIYIPAENHFNITTMMQDDIKIIERKDIYEILLDMFHPEDIWPYRHKLANYEAVFLNKFEKEA